MNNKIVKVDATIEDVQLGLRDITQSVGELAYIYAVVDEEALCSVKGMASILKMIQAAMQTQQANVDALVAKAYPGKAVGA